MRRRTKIILAAFVVVLACLAVFQTALTFQQLYVDYRDSNVRKIKVSTLAELGEVFEIGESSLQVRDPKFLKICFAGDYVYALREARHWFAANEIEFMPALEAAGGPADTFNGGGNSSIVLLTHTSAVILQLDWQTGFAAMNPGCANADTGEIEIKRYQTNPSLRFYLTNATLKSSRSREQTPTTLCAGKLQRFIESIDELLSENVVETNRFWAAIGKYLPASGCRVDEVISISRTSRFVSPPSEGPATYSIWFENSDMGIHFSLEKDTGNIVSPYVFSKGLPSL